MTDLLQLIYPVTLVLCLATGLLQLILRPELLRHYASREAVLVGGALLVFAAGMVAFGGLELYVSGADSLPVIEIAFLSTVVMLMVSVVVWPGGSETDHPRIRGWTRDKVLAVSLLPLVAFVWSAGYFVVAGLFVELVEVEGGMVDLFREGTALGFIMLAFVALSGAVTEEVVFRGYLQGRLESSPLGPWGAVLIAATIFALGHGNYVEPWGLKELQILVLGIFFGWIKLQYGLMAAVAVHLGHNAISLVIPVVVLTL